MEAGRLWDNNHQKYTYGPDSFTSVMTTIVNKASVVRDFGDEALSIGERTEKVDIPTSSPQRVQSGRLGISHP